MSDKRPAAIPLSDFRDPVLAYTIEGGDAHVTAANEAFESRFDSEPSSTQVSAIFDQFNRQDTTGDGDPLTHLVRGDRVGIRLDGYGHEGPFFVRVIPSDDQSGYLVFSDLRDCPDREDSPGIDQVASVISHDLRNPLDVAKAHLRAAEETGDPEHFQSVSDAHDRMERIIRDVLTLTRDGAVVDPSEEVGVETAARSAWQTIDSEQAALTVSDSLPTVTGDPDRLQRLFENLFRNSVEHGMVDDRTESTNHGTQSSRNHSATGNGEAPTPVSISVQPSKDGFYVADDGPGIPRAERDVVFEAGYSTRDGGTGLGLAIVERIVEAHGWEVTLTDADSGGVQFNIRV
ncbi:HAMP domain-containing histidine kinase [Halorubrum sp. BOL3-1]|uniref:sensor histidine kinase n=1 Tax=Halorubrum sp. BOL3-1 TaxID=2497325 RepID=UPI001004EB26|nr:HAMP domain-containing sensor histidine kinase [Halorubrum sp. BOL3-1]QAU14108.1 HAMP domain-containing histidine kinase [Halorubrum sp. BOL3-1]